MPKLQFVPPTSKNPIDIQFSESYKRKLKAYENNYLRILEPEIHERQQMRHWSNKAIAKPEHIKVTLLRIARTKLKAGEFEDDDSNIVTGPKAPIEGLSYMLHEVIDDETSLKNGNPPWQFPLSSDTYTVGSYTRPKFNIETNQRGDIVKSTVAGGFLCHYQEFTKEKVLELLNKYELDPNFSMYVKESTTAMGGKTVRNVQEFLEGSISDLVEANDKGYLLKDGSYGGLNNYLEDKAKKIETGKKKNAEEHRKR